MKNNQQQAAKLFAESWKGSPDENVPTVGRKITFMKTISRYLSRIAMYAMVLSCCVAVCSCNRTTGSINGHEYVDLGLSVKWATCNVGASAPEEWGDSFAWGETSPKSTYTEENSATYRKDMGDIAGNPDYDAATANWGSTWQMPTKDEIDELITKCQWTWTAQGEHKGYEVTGPNGKSIFLPTTNWRYGTEQLFAGDNGSYWSSSPREEGTEDAYELSFGSGASDCHWSDRSFGYSVRPVSD